MAIDISVLKKFAERLNIKTMPTYTIEGEHAEDITNVIEKKLVDDYYSISNQKVADQLFEDFKDYENPDFWEGTDYKKSREKTQAQHPKLVNINVADYEDDYDIDVDFDEEQAKDCITELNRTIQEAGEKLAKEAKLAEYERIIKESQRIDEKKLTKVAELASYRIGEGEYDEEFDDWV